jgi:uncharacterized membrane protein
MSRSGELIRGAPVRHEPARGGMAGAAASSRPRLDSIDLVRGLVMVLMALDHTRDFFGQGGSNLRDVTDPALFLTRWITHFCAPTFIFLAGVSAWLFEARGRSVAQVSWFLLTRGFWLMLMEFTLVRLGWTFNLGPGWFMTQVIWAIGASMVVLSGLVYLPRRAIAAIALAMIAGHNLLDGLRAEQFGALGWVWNLLHEPDLLRLGGGNALFALYPLIPWAGVMAAGYAIGPLFKQSAATRRRWLIGLGALTTLGFVVLRATNLYGDPEPWRPQQDALATMLSFVNCEKYPPSLLYLMMTLGPALLALAAAEGLRGRLAGWIVTFGRVPFFYYVAHIFLLHALAIGFALLTVGQASWLFGQAPGDKPAEFGLALPGVYLMTVVVLVLLWPLCRWFAARKEHRPEWWWSYL